MSDAATVSLSASARLVAGALAETEQITVVALGAAAGVSKSTVAKTLTLLERSGAAIRTVREGDGVREADLWSPGAALGSLLFTTAVKHSGYGHAAALSASTEIVTTAEAAEPGLASTTVDDESADDSSQVLTQAAPDAPADADTAVMNESLELNEVAAQTPPSANMTAAQSHGTQGEPQAESSSEPTTTEVGDAPAADGAALRLAPGALAAMVSTVLAAHPDIEYTPTMLSHLLNGRSSGAIHNVLEKMITNGSAVRTCDRPKRYRHVADGLPVA
jgi:hypothetical protein